MEDYMLIDSIPSLGGRGVVGDVVRGWGGGGGGFGWVEFALVIKSKKRPDIVKQLPII